MVFIAIFHLPKALAVSPGQCAGWAPQLQSLPGIYPSPPPVLSFAKDGRTGRLVLLGPPRHPAWHIAQDKTPAVPGSHPDARPYTRPSRAFT